ncbi:MAG: sodium-translocating pyrophosphatase [Chloroflexi bacterium]|nr:sodium-translocating pyrophosphatase [Chloroflexota bacterium]
MGVWSVLGVAIAGLLYAVFLTRQILRADQGTDAMRDISARIRLGAVTYLNRQLRTIVVFIAILTLALFASAALVKELPKYVTDAGFDGWSIALGRAGAFLMGSLFSLAVGQIGMRMAVLGNVRVAAAARRSFGEALRVGYRTGTITGMLTDGLGLLGGTIIFMMYGQAAPEVLLGFGFGGTLIALFMRVGGGIYTKAADVGADLVGKVEKDLPEDDPRNAAVIADLVGDNVGDCAGMAADVFESYEVTIVAAMILGISIATAAPMFDFRWILFPLLVRAIGVVSSIISTYSVRVNNEQENAFKAIDRGFRLAALISTVGFWMLAMIYMNDWRVAAATTVGIALAVLTNILTEHFTSTDKPPVKEIVRATSGGPATTILSGLFVGMESSVWAIGAVAMALLASVMIFRGESVTMVLYGVALCGIGQLTLTGNNISMDAFGPIADNANGIGEMAHLEPHARKIMADLDAVGNTTKAVTKGIAIASAVIAAVSLFGAFGDTVLETLRSMKLVTPDHFAINVAAPNVFIGMLLGGAIPFLFSGMTIRAVGRSANLIVDEVRRQFRIPGLMEGKVQPDYGKAVSICTNAAQRELLGVGVLAVIAPVVVGFMLYEEALGGFLGGVILSGQLMAVFMANAGGAWDNAKKVIEDEPRDLVNNTGKGSERHKASVVGDTVGDPLKDTSGPALNPLIKVINLVAVLIVPLVVQVSHQTQTFTWSSPIAMPWTWIAAILLAVAGVGVWLWRRNGLMNQRTVVPVTDDEPIQRRSLGE